MSQISVTSKFQRAYKKAIQHNLQLEKKVKKTLVLMQSDLNHPSLRLHKLSGRQIYSVSVDMSIRIIFQLQDDFLLLIDMGTHEEVY